MAAPLVMSLRQRVLAGAQLAAAQRDGGVGLEQLRVGDHAGALEQLADLARVGAGGHGDHDRALRVAVEGLEGRVDQPQRAADQREREHGEDAPREAMARRAGRAAAVGARVAQRRAGAAWRHRPARGGARAPRRRRRGGLAAHGHHRLRRLPRDVVVLLHPGGLELLRGLRERILRHGLGLALRLGLGLLVEPGALDGGLGLRLRLGPRALDAERVLAGGRRLGRLRVAGGERLRGWRALTATGGAFGGGPGALFGAALRGCRLATRHVLRLHCDGRGRRTRRAVSARRP